MKIESTRQEVHSTKSCRDVMYISASLHGSSNRVVWDSAESSSSVFTSCSVFFLFLLLPYFLVRISLWISPPVPPIGRSFHGSPSPPNRYDMSVRRMNTTVAWTFLVISFSAGSKKRLVVRLPVPAK